MASLTPNVPDPSAAGSLEPPGELKRETGVIWALSCGNCGSVFYPPRTFCPVCLANDTVWHAASGRGIVYATTCVHGSKKGASEAPPPYNLSIVDTDGGLRLLSNVQSAFSDSVVIGDRVESFYASDEGVEVILFRVVRES